jgi:putative transposon-encoded protein
MDSVQNCGSYNEQVVSKSRLWYLMREVGTEITARGITPHGTGAVVIPPKTEVGSHAIVMAYPASGRKDMHRSTANLE